MKEAAVQNLLKVPSRTTMRKLRAELLTEGVHWNHVGKQRMVVYTPDGVETLTQHLAAETPEKNAGGAEPHNEPPTPFDGLGGAAAFAGGMSGETSADPVKKTGGAVGDVVEARVTRWKFPNPQVIECEHEQAGRLIVRVHDNTKYRTHTTDHKPMLVRCKITRPGHATIVGRGPRWAGKW